VSPSPNETAISQDEVKVPANRPRAVWNRGQIDLSPKGARWPGRRRLEQLVGVSVIVSGSIHGLVSPAHFREWWGYGVFFLAAAICLIGYGLALITDAIDPRYMPGDANRMRRRLYGLGIAGNLGILVLYLATRTVGIPLGPELGSVEAVGAPDVLAKTSEVLAVAGLILLLVKTRDRSDV